MLFRGVFGYAQRKVQILFNFKLGRKYINKISLLSAVNVRKRAGCCEKTGGSVVRKRADDCEKTGGCQM
jgi:hypothetical protein